MSERAQALEAALRALKDRARVVHNNAKDHADAAYAAGMLETISHLEAAAEAPPVGVSPQPEHPHEFIEVEVCRQCLRTEADIDGNCHHCDEGDGARCWWCLRLKSPASLSPVEPTPPADKRTTGLYRKFVVTRTDGTSEPGGKHEGCDYFVLDLTHDPHAVAALRAYAKSCRKDYPLLADDLDRRLAVMTGPFFQRQAGHE